MKTFCVECGDGALDLYLDGSGNLAIATGEQAAMQVCANFVRAARGEMMYKSRKGMPFFQTVFGANANLTQFEAAFRRRMKEVPFANARVREFEASVKDNTISYNAVIETDYGEVRLNV